MKEKIRLDKLLVLNNYAENVNKAKALVMSGKVIVNEKRIDKPGLKFIKEVLIRIKKKNHQWVSRGGIKLDYAIEKMKIKVENRVCADLGSSTGGLPMFCLKEKQSMFIALTLVEDYWIGKLQLVIRLLF